MELGERIRQARQEAGLSQRQLCGQTITRNMLSRIENGAVHPSMGTLQVLAGRLGKPVGWFLGEEPAPSDAFPQLQEAFQSENWPQVLQLLQPVPGEAPSRTLLRCLYGLEAAQRTAEDTQMAKALLSLVQTALDHVPCCRRMLQRELILQQAQMKEKPTVLAVRLPQDDRELLLRAEAALQEKKTAEAASCLDAARDHRSPRWNLLRGECWFASSDYARAASCYAQAEQVYPDQTVTRLEICYRELEDFKMAYFYACKARSSWKESR